MHFYLLLPISYHDILLCSDSLFSFALGIESQYRVFGVSIGLSVSLGREWE